MSFPARRTRRRSARMRPFARALARLVARLRESYQDRLYSLVSESVALFPDDNSNRARLKIEPLDPVAQIESAADRRVGVHRQQEILDEEVEHFSVDDDARDLDSLDVHRRLAVRGANAGRHADRPLAIEQFGHQPAGLVALRTPDLPEIDQGVPP